MSEEQFTTETMADYEGPVIFLPKFFFSVFPKESML